MFTTMPGYCQNRLFTRLRRGKPSKKNKATNINNNEDSVLNIILHTINIY